MALQHIQRLHPLSSSVKEIVLKDPPSFAATAFLSSKIQKNTKVSFSSMSCSGLCSPNFMRSPLLLAGSFRRSGSRAAKMVANLESDDGKKEGGEESSASDGEDDPFAMNDEERQEFRRKVREVVDMNPNIEEEADPDERKKKMQKLLANYPLVVEEDDPDWTEDADGWGFNIGQFFDKITIKNNKKDDDDDDENYDGEKEVVWQDDDYIRPIKDITTKEWEETVFKDISPLVVLVHNRYKRPKENEEIRNELQKAVHIIWNCNLPSPRCVAVDAVVELDLVSALGVSVFPQLLFTKAGKILHRETEIRTADELSKIMAFFYYGAAKPRCLDIAGKSEDAIPTVSLGSQKC